ncbi:hypothetical protein KKH15_00920 [Patescibacteria group bacterium]|nr:hypothetical protein [Patescibacteria group bacterium]MBU1754801.1 hypothetical protein [Patescibacteria group bacterium]
MALRGILFAVLIGLIGYGAMEALPLLTGPRLTLESPLAYSTSDSGLISISGSARRTETLTLNDGPLLFDENDRFYQDLLLPQGSAILTLTATDRFGRSVTERRTVFIP